MVWDSHLASEAQKWAEHLADIFRMVHDKSRPKNQGENIAYDWKSPDTSAPMTCGEAIKLW